MQTVPVNSWSVREQLCLALSVTKSDDQNWINISNLLKLMVDKNFDRPPDWFSPKSCAQQYAYLVEHVDSAKRKKKETYEMSSKSIVERLTQERLTELTKILASQREEYFQIRDEINLLKNGVISDEKLQKMWHAIKEEEKSNQDQNKSQIFSTNKRQQSKEIHMPQVSNYCNIKKESKELPVKNQEIAKIIYKDNEKKIKTGEKSSLLTSLLKSPNTLIQNQTPIAASITAANVPTNLNCSKNVTVQNLPESQQLLSKSITPSLEKKPSISTPTLSMLLEQPSTNSDKISKQQLQNTADVVELKNVQIPNTVQTRSSRSGTYQGSSMQIYEKQPDTSDSQLRNVELPQIISTPIDVVMPKVLQMDKDEINEIIGDIEELIKEEIKEGPKKSQSFSEITKDINNFNKETSSVLLPESLKSKNIDESVSLSNSPASEVSIGEIDSSTPNIAEIIGMTISTVEIKEIPNSEQINLSKTVETTNTDIKLIKCTEESKIELETTSRSIGDLRGEKEVKCDTKITKNTLSKIVNVSEEEKIITKQSIENELKQDSSLKKLSKTMQLILEQDKIKATTKNDQNFLQVKKVYHPKTLETQKIAGNIDEIFGSNASLKPEIKSCMNDSINNIIIKTESLGSKCDPQNEPNDLLIGNSLNPKNFVQKSNLLDTVKKQSKVEDLNHGLDLGEFDVNNDEPPAKNISHSLNETSKQKSNKEFSVSLERNNIYSDSENIPEIKIEIKSEIIEENSEICYVQNKDNIKKEIESITIKKEVDSAVTNIHFDEEEPSSLSKLSGGRAMKTYSKKQNSIVDNEVDNDISGETADYKTWKKHIMTVYNTLATHKYASKFLRPITEDQAPGYHSIIFRPMDLWTIKKNIDNGTIRSTAHFQRDVMLMFQNAIMFNKHNTFVHKMTLEMQEECLQHIQDLMQAVGEATFSRKTRTAANISNDATDNSLKRKWTHLTSSSFENESPRIKKRGKSENE